jgi:hypothetical protein
MKLSGPPTRGLGILGAGKVGSPTIEYSYTLPLKKLWTECKLLRKPLGTSAHKEGAVAMIEEHLLQEEIDIDVESKALEKKKRRRNGEAPLGYS